jgi:hypothetical protein
MFQPLDKDMTLNDLIYFGFFASSPRFPSLDENMKRKPPQIFALLLVTWGLQKPEDQVDQFCAINVSAWA